MTIARALVVVLVGLFAATTVVRVFALDREFPLVAVMTVFPYVVVGGGLLTAVAVTLRWRPEAAVAGACLMVGAALLAARVLPGPTPSPAPAGPRLTVAVANLREGNADAEALVDAVDGAGVDVLVVLELTGTSIEALAAAGLSARLPERVALPSRFTSGGGIWSRHPLTPREPSRSRGFGATPRATIEIPGHGPLDVDAVHPLPPITREWTAAWTRVLAGLPAPEHAVEESRRLLAGDFNATVDHGRFRALFDLGWVDAADARGAGLRPTFGGLGSGEPVPPVSLDHVLVDRAVAVEHVATRPLPGSDHRMLVARLRLPRG